MAVGLDHPEVARFLARLHSAAAVLPPARREELVSEIGEHLREALPDGATDAQVRSVLDRLGDPADIVAAETDGAPRLAGAAPVQVVVQPGSPWGGLEVAAVLLLTVGLFVVPVVGPLVGIVLAWTSPRWTRREKTVATVWAVLPAVALAVMAVTALVFLRSASGALPVLPPSGL
jgi:hypothetical protein